MPATGTSTIEPELSTLEKATLAFRSKKELAGKLAAAEARIAVLEGKPGAVAAGVPGTARPANAAPVSAAVPAAAAELDRLWQVFADGDSAAAYDSALKITAHAAGGPVPPSISTAAGVKARLEALATMTATDSVDAYRIGRQRSDLAAGRIPDAKHALSAAAKEARRERLRSIMEATESAVMRGQLAKLMPR